jgi:uncharacterized protein
MSDRSPKLQSCLYAGTVRHRRFSPEHAFQYWLFLLYLDLSELDVVFHGRWLWSTRRAAAARFRRDDHLGNPGRPLDECVRDLVEASAGTRPVGPVRLLTQLRYFGYVMNPVSLYYCFDASGEAVEAVVAQVNNTPWGERHCYVIPWTPGRSADETTARHDKVFHVSPFLPMDMQYHWRLSAPGRQLRVEIENHRHGVREFAATLSLERRPITSASLAAVLLRHPFMTGRIAGAIYWQALRLWWKGARFYPHPALPDRKLSLSKSESFTAGVRNPT